MKKGYTRIVLLLLIVAFSGGVWSCGQKGDLMLPEDVEATKDKKKKVKRNL